MIGVISSAVRVASRARRCGALSSISWRPRQVPSRFEAISRRDFVCISSTHPSRSASQSPDLHRRASETFFILGSVMGLVGVSAAGSLGYDRMSRADAEANRELPDGYVEEPESKTRFPHMLSEEEVLVATGVRLMTPLKVQVYSLGLYTDPKLARLMLSRWVEADASRLMQDSSFWEYLSRPDSDLPRTFRMEVVREVSGKHMQNGFDRGLVPRVKRAARKEGLPGGKEALRVFNGAFRDAGILKEGQEVLIRCLGQGRLRLEIEGRPHVELDSPALVHCFLDMFLGEKSVAPNVKERIANGFAEMLQPE